METEEKSSDAAAGLSPARHWSGFLVSGLLALAVDACVLEAGVRLFGLPPLIARLIAISVAMVAAWLAHRHLTFAVTAPPSWREFARYAAAAWTTAGINYLCFAALLLTHPKIIPLAALIMASIVATIFSYLSMRYGVFRRGRR
ncbi:MAG: GtrA family protein [Hyphomicrobiaceae bacterium]